MKIHTTKPSAHKQDELLTIQYHINRQQYELLKTKQTNSVVSVRKRTIPTEQPPLVGEVSAHISG
jgi:hypothetical protein